MLRGLTAACQNDYNCKAAAKQGAAALAAGLLSARSSDTVLEAVCLLYTLTTQAEARLAVGKALVKTSGPEETPAVGQLFVLVADSNPGQSICSHNSCHTILAASCMHCVWLECHGTSAHCTSTKKQSPTCCPISPASAAPTALTEHSGQMQPDKYSTSQCQSRVAVSSILL